MRGGGGRGEGDKVEWEMGGVGGNHVGPRPDPPGTL